MIGACDDAATGEQQTQREKVSIHQSPVAADQRQDRQTIGAQVMMSNSNDRSVLSIARRNNIIAAR